MIGGIYSDQRCPKCGAKYRDDGRKALRCLKHPDQIGTKFKVRFGRQVTRRFSSYREAERFLNGLRFQYDQGTFDPREWKRDHPLGFATLAQKWLVIKKEEVKPKTFSYYKNFMQRAREAWGQMNVREIGYAEIEDLIRAQPGSEKTRANMCACLHAFWNWLRKRKLLKLHEIPEFPEIKYELGFRKTVDKETQQRIIDEVHRISYQVNPKIWLGIKWLATYINVRPGELLKVKEEDIDLVGGFVVIRFPKEKKPKTVPLLEADVELLKAMPRGLPNLPFFRHNPSYGSVEGRPFGEKYFYKWWKRACSKLGIQDVDLYGGTRHSSARALRVEQNRTPEEIKKATGHSSHKAFGRYFDFESDDLRSIYADTAKRGKSRIDTPLTPQKQGVQESQVIELKRK